MIPITKNIIVVDENGTEYEATFPKRAKGLVKKGRARFISENKICLACPPNKILEDHKMENQNNVNAAEQTAEPSMEYIMSRIDQILKDTDYIYEAIDAVKNMEAAQPSLNVNADTSRGEAITSIVQARESTNQQMLRLLEKMYDDLKPKKTSDDVLKFRELADALCKFPPETASDILKKAAQQMFVKAGASAVI